MNIEQGMIVHFCCSEKCCPTLEIFKHEVLLHDDHGNTTRMTRDQFAELVVQAQKGFFDNIVNAPHS